MNIDDLVVQDFEKKDEKFWEEFWQEIDKLSIAKLKEIADKWDYEEIQDGIQDVIFRKAQDIVRQKLVSLFQTEEDKEVFDLVFLQDRDITWHFLKNCWGIYDFCVKWTRKF